MKEIKGAIFDLDGVIVDTAKYHFLAWKSLADDLKINFTESDNELLKGVSRMASLDIILGLGKVSLDDEKKKELADIKNKRYVEYISKLDSSALLKGAGDYLNQLKSKGIKLALGSASKNASLILNNTGIAPLFDAIVDGNEVSKAKPDPEVFLKGAEKIGVEPENCVVFEDSIAGIEAALNGGMKVVGIGNPDILNKAHIVVAGLFEAPEDLNLSFKGL